MTGRFSPYDPYYVYDNVYDMINEVNFGNSLACLLQHQYPESDLNTEDPFIFIYYSNFNLEKKTSMAEVGNLLKYHHPKYRASNEIKDFIFLLDKDGNISIEDPAIQRIVEIRNGYVTEYNSRHETKLPFLTIEEAIQKAVFQKLRLEDGDRTFDVGDILNTVVMLKDSNKEYSSSLVTRELVQIIIFLIADANRLNYYINDAKFIRTELLDKYFNNKDNKEDYPQGVQVSFYLGGKRKFYYPKIEQLHSNETSWLSIVGKASEIMKDDFPGIFRTASVVLEMSYLDIISSIYSMMHAKGLTALEAFNIPYRLSNEAEDKFPYQEARNGYPSLVCRKIGSKIAAHYTIYENLLHDKCIEVLDPKYRNNIIIRRRIGIIIRYLNKMSAIYETYHLQTQAYLK